MKNVEFDDMRKSKKYDIGLRSGKGSRKYQQDAGYIAVNDNELVAVICDGMGGLNGGQEASHTAVEAFIEFYQYYAKSMEGNDYEWRLDVIHQIDDIIYSLKDADNRRIGAGTTLISAIINDNRLYWLSVGDSRMYIIRRDEIVPITNDHNYHYILRERLNNKQISYETYQKELIRGEALVSFLGMGGLEMIDINDKAFVLQSGDIVLICTDGLYRCINENVIKEVLNSSKDMQEAADYIEDLIKKRGLIHQDNYTYVLIKQR